MDFVHAKLGSVVWVLGICVYWKILKIIFLNCAVTATCLSCTGRIALHFLLNLLQVHMIWHNKHLLLLLELLYRCRRTETLNLSICAFPFPYYYTSVYFLFHIINVHMPKMETWFLLVCTCRYTICLYSNDIMSKILISGIMINRKFAPNVSLVCKSLFLPHTGFVIMLHGYLN